MDVQVNNKGKNSHMDKQENRTRDYPEQGSRIRRIVRGIARGILPIVVLAVGVYASFYIFSTAPKAKRQPRKKNVPIVETVKSIAGNHSTVINAMGTVKPARMINLSPQVSGVVVSLNGSMVPGGLFTRGDTLLQLDSHEYQLAVRQQKNGVIKAENNLEIEQGKQMVAARELELSGEQVTDTDRRLMLREPQLQSLKNELETARAKLEQIQLDLEHTRVTAPFNGIVQSLDVNVGSWLSRGAKVATLVGTDSFWVEASIPEDQLRWIDIPQENGEKGAAVKIYNPSSWGNGQYREGRVIQLLPNLESRGRMARLLIEIEDPLSLQAEEKGRSRLLIGAFVRLLITGNRVENVIKIPRKYLHEGNTLWVYRPDDTLALREVAIIFQDQDWVLIKNALNEQEEIVISSVTTPVEGMKLAKQSGKPAREKRNPQTEGLRNADAAGSVTGRGDS